MCSFGFRQRFGAVCFPVLPPFCSPTPSLIRRFPTIVRTPLFGRKPVNDRLLLRTDAHLSIAKARANTLVRAWCFGGLCRVWLGYFFISRHMRTGFRVMSMSASGLLGVYQ